MPPARHHLAVLAAVSVTCLMWSDIPTADTYFGDSPWFEEWSHSGFGGELHGWKPTHAAWERMQALVRALLFPVVFYRVLTADAKHMNLLAPRVRSPSRALAVVFGSLWPRHGDWLGFFVLWTMVLCRCVLGLGEMLSSGVHTWHNVIHLLAPLPGILAGHWYFRNHSHFWEFVTVSPFGSVAEEDLPSDAVLADGTPVTMPETVALPAEEVEENVVYVSVEWAKRKRHLTTGKLRKPPVLTLDTKDAWFDDNNRVTALASPTRSHSKQAFEVSTVLGEEFTASQATPTPRHVRRSRSLGGSDAEQEHSQDGSSSPRRVLSLDTHTPTRDSATTSSGTGMARATQTPPASLRRRHKRGHGRGRGGSASTGDATGSQASRARGGSSAEIKRSASRTPSLRQRATEKATKPKESLLDRAVSGKRMLGLSFVAGVLSSADAFCQYFGHPDIYSTWQVRQLVIGRWRDAVLALYLAPLHLAAGIGLVCSAMWLAGSDLRETLERLALGWLSYFSFLAMHRWCDIIFAVVVGIVYRSHMEEANLLVSKIGAQPMNPSEYQRLLRKIRASNKAMSLLLWYIAVNGFAYFLTDSYSRFWSDQPDVGSLVVWIGFGARHALSVLPPAVLLWNIACLNEATHERVVDRWHVMFLQWHHMDRLLKLRNKQAAKEAKVNGLPPPAQLRLCFERYECTDWVAFVHKYRRGYLYVISWVSKKAFYTWLFVALFTTVQANWAAALVHVKSLVVKSGLL